MCNFQIINDYHDRRCMRVILYKQVFALYFNNVIIYSFLMMFVFKNFCLKFICLLQDDLKTQYHKNNKKRNSCFSHKTYYKNICEKF